MSVTKVADINGYGINPAVQEVKVDMEMIEWEDEAQKSRCSAYLAGLKDAFLKARYFSIQGIPCSTAENARAFMNLIDTCKNECPAGFLKNNGYTSRVIRNLSWLEKLGTDRCLE